MIDHRGKVEMVCASYRELLSEASFSGNANLVRVKAVE